MSQIENKLMDLAKQTEIILKEELAKTNIEYGVANVRIYPKKNVGVGGDGRTYEYPAEIELRDKKGKFIFPPEILENLSTRITNEVKGINRVVIDITNSLY